MESESVKNIGKQEPTKDPSVEELKVENPKNKIVMVKSASRHRLPELKMQILKKGLNPAI